MDLQHYINLKEDELDKPVYRIMPVIRLLDCFENNKLALVPPRKWDDPFENLLLSSKVMTSNGETGNSNPFSESIYGQCWTTHRETDAMWRIYSHDKNGAKVRTTPRKLIEALASSDSISGESNSFIGKVKYQTKKDLVNSLMSINTFRTKNSDFAKSLMYKRREFSHEKEVRLVYTNGSGEIHSFKINPNQLFEEIVFDPRMDENLFMALKDAIIARGFKNRAGKSVLYKPPKNLRITL